VAVAVYALASKVLVTFDPAIAFVTLGFLAATGIGVPILVRALPKGLGRRQLRAELDARIVDDVQGAQDILAFGHKGGERYETTTINTKLGRVQRWMTLVTGLQNALGRAIGPVWDGNEVWLIAAGGTLFFALPTLYASGFYLPLIIVLWLLMIGGSPSSCAGT